MRDRVLDFVKANGPVLPNAVAKQLKLNSILAGAFLSSLISAQLIKVSTLKIGSSPLYYAPGQEEKLQEFSSNLNEKDFKTYLMLRDERVVRWDSQDALTRVSLTQISDFAIPINVNFQGETVKFYKWYMVPNSELNTLIAHRLGVGQESDVDDDSSVESVSDSSDSSIVDESVESNLDSSSVISDVDPSVSVAAVSSDSVVERAVSAAQPEIVAHSDLAGEYAKRIEELEKLVKGIISQPNDVGQNDLPISDNSSDLPKVLKHLPSLLSQPDIKQSTDDDVYVAMKKFSKANNFKIHNFKILRKGSEGDFIIDVEHFYGIVRFFAKVKNKKSANDSDLQLVIDSSKHLDLPGILICSGDLNKKGKFLFDASDVYFSKINTFKN